MVKYIRKMQIENMKFVLDIIKNISAIDHGAFETNHHEMRQPCNAFSFWW